MDIKELPKNPLEVTIKMTGCRWKLLIISELLKGTKRFSEIKKSTRLFRIGIYLFTVMNWISKIGYEMFALDDAGKQISSFQEVMHMAVTALVVILSIVSLILLIISGIRNKEVRGVGIWAAIFFAMMLIGPIGMKAFPPQYFGIAERFSIYSAIGLNAVLGIYLFNGFETEQVRL